MINPAFERTHLSEDSAEIDSTYLSEVSAELAIDSTYLREESSELVIDRAYLVKSCQNV